MEKKAGQAFRPSLGCGVGEDVLWGGGGGGAAVGPARSRAVAQPVPSPSSSSTCMVRQALILKLNETGQSAWYTGFTVLFSDILR